MDYLRILGILLLFSACGQMRGSTALDEDEGTVDNRKVFLQATNGDQMHLSFAVGQRQNSDGSERVLCASRISIGLVRARHTAQRVRTVLINQCLNKQSGFERRVGQQVDLTMSYRNMTFSRYLGEECLVLKKWRSGEHVENCTQELAVVVDGDWLTDPINGTHNFLFEMAYAARQ
jgi:hypothetical protein